MVNVNEKEFSLGQIEKMWKDGIRIAAKYAYESSPFYRRLFKSTNLTSEDIQGIDELHRLPFTTKDDLGVHADDFWAVPQKDVVDIATISGTIGIFTLYPMALADVKRLGWNEYLSFCCAGLTAQDTVLLSVTMDRCFIAGLAYYEGLKQMGSTVLRIGSGPPGMLLDFIKRLQPTAVVSVPSFLKKVQRYAVAEGFSLEDTSVSKLICIGEPIRDRYFSLNALGQSLENTWNARVYSTYAMTELATSFCECEHGVGGHVHPSLTYVEIVDDDGNPVSDGEIGEIVATAFGVTAFPLLRFRTGDCSFMIREKCPCGRWTPRLGPIVGRKKHLMKIKGVSVYPTAVQQVLDGIDEVLDYVMILTSPTPLSDELTIKMAIRDNPMAVTDKTRADSIQRQIEERLQSALKVRPFVHISPLSEIEQLQGIHILRKKRVLVDLRQESENGVL